MGMAAAKAHIEATWKHEAAKSLKTKLEHVLAAAVVPQSARARLAGVKWRRSAAPVASEMRLTEASMPPDALA